MIRRLLSKLPLLGAALGDVVYETSPLKGQVSSSFLQWRLKQTGDGKKMFVGIKLRPDRSAGRDGAVTNYIELTIEAAEQAKIDLERCIAEYHRRSLDGSIKS